MKYTKQEKLDIGRRIYEDKINKNAASELYGISPDSAREYMRYYRDINHLPPKDRKNRMDYTARAAAMEAVPGLDELESMSKEELIRELLKERINETQSRRR